MPQGPVYLDDNGNPIHAGAQNAASVYLDDQGEPIQAGPMAPSEGSGSATAALTTARAIPAGIRTGAQGIVNSPAAQRMAQKVIMGATRGAGTLAGNAVGGVPGAIVGNTVSAGLTPTQATIRSTVGRLAGEAPHLTDAAIKAQAITDYGKGIGIRVNPGAIVDNPAAGSALDNYASSMGKKVVRLYDGSGRIISGPQAETAARVMPKAPGLLSKAAKALPLLSAATGMTDFAQTVEPDRHDIGVMGIGRTTHVPGEHPAVINALAEKIRAMLAARLGGQP